jgi:hypothetical protein
MLNIVPRNNVMPSQDVLSVIMLVVIMLSVTMLSVIMLSVIMLSVILLSVMLSAVILGVLFLCFTMLRFLAMICYSDSLNVCKFCQLTRVTLFKHRRGAPL